MAIVDKFDVGVNFWESNPQLKAAGPFAELYSSDSTKGKSNSSKKMWCIALIWDRESKYFGLHMDEKTPLIFGDFYGDKTWPSKNKEEFDRLSAFYKKLSDTPAMRTLREIEDKLDERSKFLKDTAYTIGEKGDKGYIWGTADLVDKMLANTNKIYEMYEKALATVGQEKAQGVAVGKATQSLTDNGEI